MSQAQTREAVVSNFNTKSATYDFQLSQAIQNLRKANIHYTVPLLGRDERMTARRRIAELSRVIGERFFCIRTDLGLTQKEVAEKSGLAAGTISMIERGKAGGMVGVILYADALAIPLEILFENTMKDAKGQFTAMAMNSIH